MGEGGPRDASTASTASTAPNAPNASKPPGSKYAGRAVAIDSCVARRPPALKSCAEDSAVERLAQLVLMAPDVAAAVVAQALGPDTAAAAGGGGGGGVAAFQRGFRETLVRVLRIKVRRRARFRSRVIDGCGAAELHVHQRTGTGGQCRGSQRPTARCQRRGAPRSCPATPRIRPPPRTDRTAPTHCRRGLRKPPKTA